MARLPFVDRDDFPDDLVYLLDAVARDTGEPPNIFRTMGNNPALLRDYRRLGNGLWTHCGLDVPTRELVILRTAILAGSQYEWHQHVAIGRRAGLTDDRINALHDWQASPLFSKAERALLGYVDAAFPAMTPAQEAHDVLAAHFPPSTVVGVNLLTNFYLMTAKFLAGMEVETETPFVGWKV